jgi:membrane-associated phospholipid phosphatase
MLTACTVESPTAASVPEPTERLSAAPAAGNASASARWNVVTQQIIARREMGPLGLARSMALVSVAQYNAVIGAEKPRGHGISSRGARIHSGAAVAAASAAVLTAIYPIETLAIEAQLAADRDSFTEDDGNDGVESGEAVGRAAAAAVMARAATDGSAAVWTGTTPTGPGVWFSAPLPARPLSPLWGQVRPWLMTSGDQFRPAAPPAAGSPAFNDALAEVRRFSDTQTPEQLAIAQFWGAVAFTAGPPGYWSNVGLALAAAHRRDERTTARMLAMMHMAGMDASIGCWDAKYAYWLARPYQMDPAIKTPVGRPNFPAFPSAHSCLSAAYAGVLAGVFPSATRDLMRQVDEAGVSRIYAGLHYRFDVTAGQQIGASVSALALRHAPRGKDPIPLD